jgi:L-ascorbate metabolism protein UlaG (beta-lactamase superfamily)
LDRIRWINHAGFELQTEGLRIVCDPWLDGLAFEKSWALLSETVFTPADFSGVNYLWFSHEHPDHFSPKNIRSIPESVRATITVLFQKTKDGRVAKFCRELGFKAVLELADWERVELGSGVFFTIKTVDDDSLCFIETPNQTYLNMNDCVAADAESLNLGIALHIGSPDVLLTQFSFANWAGNPDDQYTMQRQAQIKLDQIDFQLSIYKPRVLIPFASFVWFCRSENFHLNAGSNKIADVYRRFAAKVEVVVLYPGDLYNVGREHDSSSSIDRYTADESRHREPLVIEDETFSVESLNSMSDHHQQNIRRANSMWIFWPLLLLGYIKPVSIYLTDIKRSLTYSMLSGIRWTAVPRIYTDIEFSSRSMAQMLRHGTGYDTLYISGRFTEHTEPASRI